MELTPVDAILDEVATTTLGDMDSVLDGRKIAVELTITGLDAPIISLDSELELNTGAVEITALDKLITTENEVSELELN